ncbi:MAG: ABC transporter permease, partial [Fermentimonas sp.]|nr:ABC transporter permease [Fermentimonas sp.]
MTSLSLIIQREYLTRVRKKSFIILTLLMPFLMVALSLVPLWLSTLNDGSIKNVAVIDNTGIYAPLLESTDQFEFQIIGKADQQDSESRLG